MRELYWFLALMSVGAVIALAMFLGSCAPAGTDQKNLVLKDQQTGACYRAWQNSLGSYNLEYIGETCHE